jgi:hypothetical protein
MRKLLLLMFLIYSVKALSTDDRIRIVIIDTGISVSQYNSSYVCKDGHKSFVDTDIYDTNGHGTNIISIVSLGINVRTHCIVSYKFYSDSKSNSIEQVINALLSAMRDDRIKYINMSMEGAGSYIFEKKLIRALLDRGVIITVAAGNKRQDLDIECNTFPACYKKDLDYENFYVVGSKLTSSNYGKVVTDIFSGRNVGSPIMSGTSQASAQKLADILKHVVL